MTSSQPRSGIVQASLTLAAIVGTFAVNSLSNFYPPGGQNVGEISNTVFRDVLIIPANYAFIIWGIIYVGLFSYGIYQLQPAQRQDEQIRRANRYLVAACLIQIVWIYLFTMQWFWLSVVAMLGILGTLVGVYQSLNIGRSAVSSRRRWLSHIPLSIYLAWISVATIVNVASALYDTGMQSYGIAWTIVMLLVGSVLASLVIGQRQDAAFTLVFVWAYVAIAVGQQDKPALVTVAVGLAIAMVAYLLYRYWANLKPSSRFNRSAD